VCTFSDECERSATFGALCEAGACREATYVEASLGDACGVPSIAGDTATIPYCSPDAICDLDTETCVVPPGFGEPCTSACASPYVCADVCVAIEIVDEAGAACDGPMPEPLTPTFRFCNPYIGLACNAGGVCECMAASCSVSGAGAVGDSCFGFPSCDTSNYCDPMTDTCAARSPIDTTCTQSEECLSGSCIEGLCAPYCSLAGA
jgi:hypothetical protein